MMDIGRRDFFIPIPAAISEETPVSWWEGYKANVAYNNMPLIESFEEDRLFGNAPLDEGFDVAANISEELLPYYDDLIRAKNPAHLAYLEERAYTAIERRRKSGDAPITAMLAGGMTDPLALVSFIPGLQFIKVGKTFGQAVTRGAAAGFAYGVASEARRAPFAVADEPYEAATNIVASTALSAGFGGLMRTAPYVKPFFQSTASKMGRLYRGEKFKHVWSNPDEVVDPDAMVVYSPDGTASVATVVQRSESGGIIVRTSDGKEEILGLSPLSQKSPYDPEFVIETIDGTPSVKNLSDDELLAVLDTLERKIAVSLKNKTPNYEMIRERNAIKIEQKKRSGEAVTPPDVPALPTITNLDDGYTAASGGDFDTTQVNWMGSPSQRAMQRDDLNDEVKEFFALLSYNGSVSTQGARRGRAFQSVSQEAQTFIGTYERLHQTMRDLHSQQVRGIAKAARVGTVYNPVSGFDDWAKDTIRRHILSKSTDPRLQRLGKDGMTSQQKEAGVLLGDLFKGFSDDMNYSGLVKNNEKLNKIIATNQAELDKKIAQLADLEDSIKKGGGATKKQLAFRDALENRQAILKARIEFYEGQIDKPLRSDFVFPIFYDKGKLALDEPRSALTNVFAEDYKMQRLAEGQDPDGAFSDAERTLSRIMQEDGEEMENLMRSRDTAGRAKHLKQRKTNIDVAKVVDYIHADMEALYTYIDRMGRQVSFANKFGGRNIDEVIEDLDDALIRAGKNPKERSRLLADFYGDYERVMGTLQRSPDRWDNQAAKAAKAWTGWTFLPLAGVSAITDTGSIVMAHGMKDVIAAGFAATDTAFTGKVVREGQLAGELLDITKNVYAREMLNDTARKVKPNLNERIIQRGNQFMYSANGLALITFGGKTLDQILTNNKFIKLSRQWSEGKISLFDREYLARYGIDEDMAKFIAKAPTEKHDRFDFEFANTDAWDQSTPQAREIMRKYQAALASHANNTIVMGQTFDKPLIVDGVAYLRDNPFFQSVRKAFPSQFPIEKRLRTGAENMVRIESGLMSLPFTFMNFAFGANNKILGAIRDPNRRYRLQGVAALIGLSYMSLAIKKPDYWFEKRSTPEIMARIIDHSGVLGIYSDLAYTGLNIAGNAGMISEDFPIPPKYVSPNRDERMMDAFVEPFGAPAGLGLEYGRALKDFMDGNTSDASERLKYALPFIGLYPIRDDMRELVGSVGRN